MAVISIRTRQQTPRMLAVGAGVFAALGAAGLWLLAVAPQTDEKRTAVIPAAAASTAPQATWALALEAETPHPRALPPVPPAAAAASVAPIPTRVAAPYRFVGHMTAEGGKAWVFFGRGRTVLLPVPGPLDDEYAVDAILEHQILLRHVPTAASQFVELSAPQADSTVSAAPDNYPQD